MYANIWANIFRGIFLINEIVIIFFLIFFRRDDFSVLFQEICVFIQLPVLINKSG